MIIIAVFFQKHASKFAMPSLKIYTLAYLLAAFCDAITAACEPFVYERPSDCATALAAGSYANCSALNTTLDRDFCQVSSLDDLDKLENVARVLGYDKVRKE